MNKTMAIETNGDKATTHPLLELVELTYKQFKLIAEAHAMLLKNYLSVTQRHSIVVKPYDIADYWTQAQAVVGFISLALTMSAFDLSDFNNKFLFFIISVPIVADGLSGNSKCN